jgi:hypothetical protein
MDDEFTLRNLPIQVWLTALVAAEFFIATTFPPSFWLCGVGMTFFAVASLANTTGTGQWFHWQNEGALNWFEGWVAATGATLLAVPLLAIIFRSWLA